MKTLAILSVVLSASIGAVQQPPHAAQTVPSSVGANAGDLAAQDQCNRQSFDLYKSEGYASDSTASYTIHFNGKLKQCFVLFRKIDRSTMPGNEMELRVFMDANTKKIYGNYVFSAESQRTVECDVLDSSDKKKDCSSFAEFESLTAPYME